MNACTCPPGDPDAGFDLLCPVHGEGSPSFIRGVEAVLLIRCIGHRAIPQYNTAEVTGAECAACAVEAQKKADADLIGDMVSIVAALRAECQRLEDLLREARLRADSDATWINRLREQLERSQSMLSGTVRCEETKGEL